MYKKDSEPLKNRTLKLVIYILTLLCLTGAAYYFYNSQKNNISSENSVNSVNYDPPTKEEASAGDKQKQVIADSDKPAPLPDQAEVVIVDSTQYDNEIEVRAFTANVIEDGTCTITFIKDSLTIEKEVPAYADASTTPCITLTVPRSDFSESGLWNVTVVYKNTKIMGSAQGTIDIE